MEFEKAVEEAFRKHRIKVGNEWSSEFVITEDSAEDFVKTVLELMKKNANTTP